MAMVTRGSSLLLLDIPVVQPVKMQYLLTFIAFDGVNINGGIKLSRRQRLGAIKGIAGTVGRRSNAASVAFALLLSLIVLTFHLFLLSSLHVMDAHQQTVVHEFELGQELKRREMVEEMKGFFFSSDQDTLSLVD